MSVVQISVIGVIGVLLAVQLKSGKAEYGIYIGIAISLFLFVEIIGKLEQVVQTMEELSGYFQLHKSYISTLMKMLGITYISEFASAICKDAGYHTIATQIEIFSKVSLMVLSLPILLTLLETIQEFLG